jgi:hypothetical protein
MYQGTRNQALLLDKKGSDLAKTKLKAALTPSAASID